LSTGHERPLSFQVEIAAHDWGQALCPALDALLKWAALREEMADGVPVANKE